MLLRAIAGAQTVDRSLLARQVENLAVDWLQYGEEKAYADRADAVIAALAELLPEHAEQVRPLLRRVLELLGQAAGRSEDHSGAALASAAEAWDVFLTACDEAPPDPVELGIWFADFRLTGVDILDMSITDVADLLGTDGLDAYWNALDAARGADPGDWTVRSLREEMIQATGMSTCWWPSTPRTCPPRTDTCSSPGCYARTSVWRRPSSGWSAVVPRPANR
ncbi:hypothetical protein [Actinoplanes rectilineatus]|uniref:hypothetical protein n=1 Tax=Actinoplanes rectilineatus TaxID=113571 RepID=UPI0005F2AB24|nr:hypothetical protein [Actinoplanes rectilineatus]